LILTVALATVIGISLGLLGGGGSILAVPLLIYAAGMPAKEAIATSLLVVGTTSAVAVLPHLRAGRVRWRTGLVFGAAGMAGAYSGGRLAAYIPDGVLLTAFALMMLATAAAMIRGRRRTTGEPVPHELPVLRVIVDGVAVGLVTGLVGAGGGFLVVPALALLGGLPMPVAVGTSLVVIAMKSFAGFAGYLSGVPINWGLAGAVTLAAVAGSLLGARLAGRIPADVLRMAFGWFVVVMGVFVLAQQLPAQMREAPWLWITLATLVAGMIMRAILRHRSHRRAGQPRARNGQPGCNHPRSSPDDSELHVSAPGGAPGGR
jgi:uncharacterized membrane protein YfcA